MKKFDLSGFAALAEAVTQAFITLPENPKQDRTGGYIAVMSKDNRQILLIAEFGECLPDRIKSGWRLCQEKAKRLASKKTHHSSWQSRNVEKRRYGGAITSRTSSFVGSMSGFIEHGDEAILLVIWHLMDWLPLSEAEEIASFSQNTLFPPLLARCSSLKKRHALQSTD